MCLLHNIVKTREPAFYTPPGFVDSEDMDNGQWRNENFKLAQVPRQGSRNATTSANNMRDNFCRCFNSDVGIVEWQNNYLNRLE